MIPDFKTYIGESIWRNISQRSEGIKSRKEDENPLLTEFNKIKKMDLLRPGTIFVSGIDYLWTPCNFGANSPEEPGLYLSGEEILELYDILEGTNYEIVTETHITHLISRPFKQKKFGDYYGFVLQGYDGNDLLLMNFGVFSIIRNEIIWENMNDMLHYGGILMKKPAYTAILKSRYKSLDAKTYIDPGNEMKYQVRLVKRIRSIYGEEEYEEA